MKITLPIYVQKLSDTAAHVVRPLFFARPEARDENLNRAITKLAKELRRTCDALGRDRRHDALSRYGFCPDTDDRLLKVTLDLSDRKPQCRFLIVAFEHLGRKLAFTPSVPDLWFEIARGETILDRAAEVLTVYFRNQQRKDGASAVRPESLSVDGKAWVTTLEISVNPPALAPTPQQVFFAALGAERKLDGAEELENVGRCLDYLYPDDLDRVTRRDAEVSALTKLLTGADRRPVLLIGPRLVGKTALIHEYVYQKVSRRKSTYSAKQNVWLLAPQRLVSGMSFVGQWENRLLAIIEEAKKRNHILYFDDLLGLFQAGQSASSNLSMADVLKPYVEKREFRLLAEITPEAFRVFQEKDRGLADQFHLLAVKEPDEDTTLRILLGLMRRLENAHRCQFDTEVFPTVMDIQRRYVRDGAFPGKAAAFLQRLAVKFRNAAVTRANVLEEFHAKSGLAISFLNNREKLEHKTVTDALGQEVIGQPTALAACADVVTVAKARLNDTSRPLASFLFLGPTGVGKTQCAKSLAAYLFGDADKILRFDMNEYSSAYAAARLVGTFDQPEGLLASAIRRQPFAVVLLDEIEKAHADVFNLLLQVMGDGRLTDALGRTVDFTNAILILTSNLGVREAASGLGFLQDRARESQVYVQAAERFFKPEFFNRLDRVVPFAKLRREDVREIARGLIRSVFARDGLVRRRCVLEVDERAMERIVDEGYHPQLGARALKRMIEKRLTQGVAARLVSLRVDAPTIVSVYPSGDDLAVVVDGLSGAARATAIEDVIELNEARAIIERVEAATKRIEAEAERFRPEGPITTDAVQPEQVAYFLIREQARRVRELCRRVEERTHSTRARFASRAKGRSLAAGQLTLKQTLARDLWQEVIAARDVRGYLKELAAASPAYGERIEDSLAELIREAACLQTIAMRDEMSRSDDAHNDQAILLIRPLDAFYTSGRTLLGKLYEKLFGQQLNFAVGEIQSVALPRATAFTVKGARALQVARREAGTHLFYTAYDQWVPVQVTVLPFAENDTAQAVIAAHAYEREQWLDRVATGAAVSLETIDHSFQLLPVVRVYEAQGATLDLRSGLMTLQMPTAHEMRAFLLATLPLPQELAYN